MLSRLAFLMLGLAALAPAAQAQSTPATVFCVNDKIAVERSNMQQMQSSRGHSTICIIGPSFDFGPDAVTWLRQNLRREVGGPCSCR